MSTDTAAPEDPRLSGSHEDLGPLPAFFRPLVDAVARIRATVHAKLLGGFLLIAVLLLSMGILSIAVLGRINGQVDKITALSDQTNQAQRMIYLVTAQSHFRAMELLTDDPSYSDKINDAKDTFATDLASIRTYAVDPKPGLFDHLASTNEEYGLSSDTVTELYERGHARQAEEAHIDQEHPISHELEDSLNVLIADSQQLAEDETASFASHRRFLTLAVASFSGASLLVALALGAVLSWSLIRPVRRVDGALERIADGDFDTRVEVPNRDEFGNLTKNLNRTTEQLSTLYSKLQDLVDAKVVELERVSRLKRYLSPGVAESIVSGERDVTLAPKRKFLTTFFSDVRGFTAASERMEPEELVDQLNSYLTVMTEIVFKHGGTLDKYVGDAVMVFFGDPIAQPDHAERAVRMAFEMKERMEELESTWARTYRQPFKIGIGIATGWVTVGDIGSPARTDYTVLGNEVNLASRLADRADAGQILVTERTMTEVSQIVEGSPVDVISLKGVSREIRIYEISPRATS